MRRDVRVGSEEFRGGVSRLLSRERDRARVSSWLCLTDGSTAAARAAACALLDPSRAFIVPGDGLILQIRSCVFPPAGQGWVKGAPLARVDSPARLRVPALTAPRRSESGFTLQRAPRGARLLPRPHEIGEGHLPHFPGAARGACQQIPRRLHARLGSAPPHTPAGAHTSRWTRERRFRCSTPPPPPRARRATPTAPRYAPRATRRARAADPRNRREFHGSRRSARPCSARCSRRRRGGRAVGSTATCTSPPWARRPGRGAREAARGPRRRRAHASRARAASSGLGDTTLEPRGIGQMPRAEPIRRRRSAPRTVSARAARSAGARAPPAQPQPASAVARETIPRRTTRAARLTIRSRHNAPSSRATIRPRRRRTRPARSSTRSRGG